MNQSDLTNKVLIEYLFGNVVLLEHSALNKAKMAFRNLTSCFSGNFTVHNQLSSYELEFIILGLFFHPFGFV